MAASGSKLHVGGEKIAPSHTTVTDFSRLVVDFLFRREGITKIMPGVMRNIYGKSSSLWIVKIHDQGSVVLVTVIQNRSVQDIRFYSSTRQDDIVALARWVRENNWQLRFTKAVKSK